MKVIYDMKEIICDIQEYKSSVSMKIPAELFSFFISQFYIRICDDTDLIYTRTEEGMNYGKG